MSDLISRQDTLEAICTWDKFGVDALGRVVWWHEGLEPYVHLRDVVWAIENMPSAQPEITLESAIDYLHSIGWMQEHDRIMTESAPVVHAYWIGLDSDAEKYDDIQCSSCNKSFTVDAYRWCDIGFTESDLIYCPNCGARMDGDKT